MTYEFDHNDQYLLSDYCEELLVDELYDVPPAAKGLRALDYEPDTDDYEYMQQICY